MSRIPSLPYALCLLLLCAFNVPAHSGKPTLGSGINRMALGPTYQWAALDSVSNRAEKTIEKPLSLHDEKKKTRSHPAWLGFDKILHFSFSAGLVGISYHGSRVVLEKDQETSQWMAGIGTGLLGIWKEWRDPHVSIGDLVADALGIAAGLVLFAAW